MTVVIYEGKKRVDIERAVRTATKDHVRGPLVWVELAGRHSPNNWQLQLETLPQFGHPPEESAQMWLAIIAYKAAFDLLV